MDAKKPLLYFSVLFLTLIPIKSNAFDKVVFSSNGVSLSANIATTPDIDDLSVEQAVARTLSQLPYIKSAVVIASKSVSRKLTSYYTSEIKRETYFTLQFSDHRFPEAIIVLSKGFESNYYGTKTWFWRLSKSDGPAIATYYNYWDPKRKTLDPKSISFKLEYDPTNKKIQTEIQIKDASFTDWVKSIVMPHPQEVNISTKAILYSAQFFLKSFNKVFAKELK